MKAKRILAAVLVWAMIFTFFPEFKFGFAETADSVTFEALDGTAGTNVSEDYDKLIDGEISTKWGVKDFSGAYIIIKASERINVTEYSFVTGNDNEGHNGRNPKKWFLMGCNDYDETNKEESYGSNGNWVNIHYVAEDITLEDKNHTEYTFDISKNEGYYQYYCLEISETKGADFMQLSEMKFKYKAISSVEITFDKNDGTGESVVAHWGDSLPDDVTNTGYIFEGWYTKNGTENNDWGEEFTDTTSVFKNTTVYAKWRKITLTFYPTKPTPGEPIAVIPSVVEFGDDMPNDPQNAGYIFEGWYTDTGEEIKSTTQVSQDTTAYAKWRKIKITFYKNDGTEEDPTTAEYGDDMPENPTREGYVFEGWYTKNAENGELENKIETTKSVSGDTSVYAKWRKVKITFDPNDETQGGSTTVDFGGEVPNSPIRIGYVFEGWYTQDDEKVEDTTSFLQDTTVYAKWRKIKITFYKEDGTEEEVPMTAEYGDDMPETPLRQGYVFVGWYTVDEGYWGTEITSTSGVLQDTTVYGRWRKAHITFDKNNETGDKIYKEYGNPMPEDPTSLCYVFEGWYTKDGTDGDWGEKFDGTSEIFQDTTVYAKWRKVIITFYKNDGTEEENPTTAEYGDDMPPNPEREGFKFEGWYTKDGTDGAWGNKFENTSGVLTDTAVYAKWNGIKITFDKNGGDTDSVPTFAFAGDDMPKAPEREDYTFEGWYTQNGANGEWGEKFESTTGVTESITVYAKWSFVSSALTFSALDGTSGSNNSENYTKLVDGKKTEEGGTKWCVSNFKDAYIVIKASEEALISGYTFTTANDNSSATGRNPKSWVLYGCNDYNETTKKGGTWSVIHKVENDATMQDVNYTAYTFDNFTNSTYYKYYKLYISANQGGDCMQLSELELICVKCEHIWGAQYTTEANCTEPAYICRKCSKCQKIKRTTVSGSAALGHSYGENGVCTRCKGEAAVLYNSEYFENFSSAVSKAQENGGGTIKLLNNVVETENITVGNDKPVDICLDLNGYVLSFENENNKIFYGCEGKTFKIIDSKPTIGYRVKAVTPWSMAEGGAEGSDIKEVYGGVIAGAAIVVFDKCTLDMQGGNLVGGNHEQHTYGGAILNYGTFNMSGKAKIMGAMASYGGGVENNGIMNMSGDAEISDCYASYNGGGVRNAVYSDSVQPVLNMSGNASIKNNTGVKIGGGVYNDENTVLNMSENASITECGSSNGSGGIYNNGTVKMTGSSSVAKCKSLYGKGGGISVVGGSLEMTDSASINNCKSKGEANGLYVQNGTVTISKNARIYSNNELSYVSSYGAPNRGVLVDSASTFFANGGSVEDKVCINENAFVKSTGAGTAEETTVFTKDTENNGAISAGVFYGEYKAGDTGKIDGKKVTYKYGNESEKTYAFQVLQSGAKAIKPQNPTMDNAIFVEWQSGGEAYDFSAAVTEDITLAGVWNTNKIYKFEDIAAAVENGFESVVLMNDITTGQTLNADDDLELDLNGYVYKYTGEDYAAVVGEYEYFTLIDGDSEREHTDTSLKNGGNFCGNINVLGRFEIYGGTIDGSLHISKDAQALLGGGKILKKLYNKGVVTLEDSSLYNSGSYGVTEVMGGAENSGTLGTGIYYGGVTNQDGGKIDDGGVLFSFKTDESVIYAEEVVMKDRELIRPQNPKRTDGKICVGWYKDSAFAAAWNFASDKAQENAVLWAKFADTDVLNGADLIGLAEAEVSKIKLAADVTVSEPVIFYSGCELDLNGHILEYKNADQKSFVIGVAPGAKLVINDSNPKAEHSDKSLPAGGIICGGTGIQDSSNAAFGGGVLVESGGFEMNGGTIYNCTADYGGGVLVEYGSFKMNGGAIENCSAVRSEDSNSSNGGYGGGVFVEYGSFEMNGGKIKNCYALEYGGGVFNADECTIKNGSITECSSGLYGGGVCNFGGLFMQGGSITNCKSLKTEEYPGAGGGVFNVRYFVMTGGKISGCTAEAFDEEYLGAGDAVLNVSSNSCIFAAGGEICDSVYNAGTILNPEADEDLDITDYTPTVFKGDVYNDGDVCSGIYFGDFTNSENGGIYGITVDYYSNETPYAFEVVPQGHCATKITDPKRGGYTFGGWYNGEAEFDYTKALTASSAEEAYIKLSAKWSEDAEAVWVSITADKYTVKNGSGATVYIGAYKGGMLLDMYSETVTSADVTKRISETTLKTTGADELRIFLWDSLQKPLCDSASVKLSLKTPLVSAASTQYHVEGGLGATVYVCAYKDDVLVDCVTQKGAESETKNYYDIGLDLTDADTVKVFLLNEDLKPLCAASSITSGEAE